MVWNRDQVSFFPTRISNGSRTIYWLQWHFGLKPSKSEICMNAHQGSENYSFLQTDRTSASLLEGGILGSFLAYPWPNSSCSLSAALSLCEHTALSLAFAWQNQVLLTCLVITKCSLCSMGAQASTVIEELSPFSRWPHTSVSQAET